MTLHRSREDREASAAGISKALQVAFGPKQDAAEAEFDRLIERLSRLSAGRPPVPARAG